MRKKINVGLIGYGMAGEFFHAPLIHTTDGLVLHSVVERNNEKSKARYPNAKIERRVEDVLSEKNIELVVIATPNKTHYEYAKNALLEDKHVVIDKPFTIRAKDAEELIALAKAHNKILSVYQNRRWDGDFLTVKKMINEGTLGDIQEYHAHYDRFRPNVNFAAWKEGEGVFYDLGPHLIDQALVLFGKPKKTSTKILKQRPDALAEDYFEVSFEYDFGHVFLSASMLMENPRPRFVVKGTKGIYTKYGLDPQENALKAGELPSDEHWGKEAEEHWGTLKTVSGKKWVPTEKGDYPAYYKNIYKAILGEEPLAVEPNLPLEAIRIIENGRNSLS